MDKLVLLAEDNDLVREMMTEVLRLLGWTVLVACDGEEALRLFRANPQLRWILSDLNMGGFERDGDTLYRTIRHELAERRGRMVVMSGKRPEHDAQLNCLVLAGVPFVAKPVPVSTLRECTSHHFA